MVNMVLPWDVCSSITLPRDKYPSPTVLREDLRQWQRNQVLTHKWSDAWLVYLEKRKKKIVKVFGYLSLVANNWCAGRSGRESRSDEERKYETSTEFRLAKEESPDRLFNIKYISDFVPAELIVFQIVLLGTVTIMNSKWTEKEHR